MEGNELRRSRIGRSHHMLAVLKHGGQEFFRIVWRAPGSGQQIFRRLPHPPTALPSDADGHNFVVGRVESFQYRRRGGKRNLVLTRPPAEEKADAKLLLRMTHKFCQ